MEEWVASSRSLATVSRLAETSIGCVFEGSCWHAAEFWSFKHHVHRTDSMLSNVSSKMVHFWPSFFRPNLALFGHITDPTYKFGLILRRNLYHSTLSCRKLIKSAGSFQERRHYRNEKTPFRR
jgi:hypothetical protein